jgi:hypothetical protein
MQIGGTRERIHRMRDKGKLHTVEEWQPLIEPNDRVKVPVKGDACIITRQVGFHVCSIKLVISAIIILAF